jgi:hypothetical protein
MTRVLSARSRLAIGIELTVQGWRQIAIGIALRKLTGSNARQALRSCLNSELGDMAEIGETEQDDAVLPEALHWQAAHAPATGNRAYGGTVNFRQGLTDAGLREFIDGSKLWHALFALYSALKDDKDDGDNDEKNDSNSNNNQDLQLSRKHARAHSDTVVSMLLPRPKRHLLPRRQGDERTYRRCWLIDEATAVLKHMYGPAARFRSSKQQEAVRALIAGYTPLLTILSTGEGKSLLYMLLARLPGAGTTVLLVPLIALRQDTVRRCQLLGIEYHVWRDSGDATAAPAKR